MAPTLANAMLISQEVVSPSRWVVTPLDLRVQLAKWGRRTQWVERERLPQIPAVLTLMDSRVG